MTDKAEEQTETKRVRHVLRRSAKPAESDAESVDTTVESVSAAAADTVEAPLSTAAEPESTAVEETTTAAEETSAAETVEAPVAAAPVADEPVADEPVADEPVADDPVADEPVPVDATTEAEPVDAEPTTDTAAEPVDADASEPAAKRSGLVAKVFAFVVIPILALVLAGGIAFLGYLYVVNAQLSTARADAVKAASDSTVTLLSYQPDSVRQQLTDAGNLLTGEFKDEYARLTNDVVIPGAEQQRISAVATVPRAASVSTEPDNAVVLVFVNQTVVVGESQPTATLSSVRVTLEKVDGKWLISKFDPV